jgi:hypothetical protein
VQDDANFVALIDVATAGVTAIDLPRGRDGARQFDDYAATSAGNWTSRPVLPSSPGRAPG